MIEESKLFKKSIRSPLWEGVIFPGLDRDDLRTVVYEADIPLELKPFIEAIWFMIWNIPEGIDLYGIGAPIPCVKLIANNFPGFVKPVTTLLGVKDKGVTLKFNGAGQAVGIDFKPGGLFPFIGNMNLDPGVALSADVILPSLPDLPSKQWNLVFAESWLHDIQTYFQTRLNNLHTNHLDVISKIVEILLNNRSLTQVDDLLTGSELSKRSLQRIFQIEVGLSIKDVIRIVRFNRTIRELNGSSIESFAQFALESGYFDQPHMINDFKKLVSESPKIFRKYW